MKVTTNPLQKRRAYGMNIITQDNHSSELLSSKINIFFNEFHVSQILKSCNAYKLRGFSVVHIFLTAFLTVFCNRSFYQMKKEHNPMIDFEQDTFYRFINSYSINWRKFTLLLSAMGISLAGNDKVNVERVDTEWVAANGCRVGGCGMGECGTGGRWAGNRRRGMSRCLPEWRLRGLETRCTPLQL